MPLNLLPGALPTELSGASIRKGLNTTLKRVFSLHVPSDYDMENYKSLVISEMNF